MHGITCGSETESTRKVRISNSSSDSFLFDIREFHFYYPMHNSIVYISLSLRILSHFKYKNLSFMYIPFVSKIRVECFCWKIAFASESEFAWGHVITWLMVIKITHTLAQNNNNNNGQEKKIPQTHDNCGNEVTNVLLEAP